MKFNQKIEIKYLKMNLKKSPENGQYINIGIGTAGVNITDSIYQQLCLEHNIGPDGLPLTEQDKNYNTKIANNNDIKTAFFDENKKGGFSARNLVVDSEPDDINKILLSPHNKTYNKVDQISGKESFGFYSRGYYTVGRDQAEKACDRIGKIIERLDNFQGFIFHGSIVGGSSGLLGKILELIPCQFSKKSTACIQEFPSPGRSDVILDSINAVHVAHELIEYTDLSILFQNEKLYDICNNNLDIYDPNYKDVNKLLAMGFSDQTSSFRFEGSTGPENLKEMQTNLVSYPRIHFTTYQMSPQCTPNDMIFEKFSTEELIGQVSQESNTFVKYIRQRHKGHGWFYSFKGKMDYEIFKSESLTLGSLHIYRGDFKASEINNTGLYSSLLWQSTFSNSEDMKLDRNKIGHCPVTRSLQDSDKEFIADLGQNLTSLRISDNMKYLFNDIAHKFQSMYAFKAYMCWYNSEGSNGDQMCSKEDLLSLIYDYDQVFIYPDEYIEMIGQQEDDSDEE